MVSSFDIRSVVGGGGVGFIPNCKKPRPIFTTISKKSLELYVCEVVDQNKGCLKRNFSK